MSIKKLAGIATALALWAAPAAHAQVVDSDHAHSLVRAQNCKPHYFIAVPGGANTVAGIPTSLPHGGNVFTTGLLVQADTAGEVQPLWVSYDAAAFTASHYPGASAGGYQETWETVTTLAGNCPEAHFSFTGYSLGADIVARMTSDIAHGRGPITADRVNAVALFANPHQGGNGGVPGSITDPGSRGSLGSLPDGYGNLGPRVLELCYADDIVCSMPERYRGIVDPAMATNLLGGQFPAADFNAVVSRLGPDALGIVAGINAHARYDFANRREAADWIVSHA
ncbi:cutinase family protein [Corynebacterium qintianiae]|uniref:Cutinase family protein n=1 Tax=Corynebacterium qintianiae TaxID=2709392 RepID=A0A7T0PFT8_9CORY|nr:cutinase family protein [Corynebacterium qintianiae]QPK83337.1 cutinase family protein [Corynebacterium qintianiae]